MTAPRLGVCYYPEHWPEEMQRRDAERMASIGLKQVRVGEFAWSRIEPSPGEFNFDWLDRAIDTLGAAGLGVVLGTPTATPPKWLVDANPEILAVDKNGRSRKFGSRRHYCFSSATYRREASRIVEIIASRYGAHQAVTAWQTDNEFGCHDTTRSYSPAAAAAFRDWLAARYGEIAALNEAWGTVFWSGDYRSFAEIDLPNLTVTEPNPSHVLDFFRFSSDQVASFNRLQADIIRRRSPGRPVMHNFMGFTYDFDHFKVAKDLDIVAWDSYPLGFLDVAPFPEDDKKRYMRQGHPDVAAFHHDLYRACGEGRWQVIEQQPGPVNWAANNPAPLPGMARLWAIEAAAHGAEALSYFRWRQAPFGQEQMHAGLLRPDDEPAPAFHEAREAAADFMLLDVDGRAKTARVAVIFSYEAAWLFEAHPQGASWSYPALVFEWYSALRRFGLNIDFLPPDGSFDGYDLVLAPSLPIIDDALVRRIEASGALFLFGPRSGSKTPALTIPRELAPGPLQRVLPLKVVRSESFPAAHREEGVYNGGAVAVHAWLDHVETDLSPLAALRTGEGLLYRSGNVLLLTGVPDHAFLAALFYALLEEQRIPITPLHQDLRLRRSGDCAFIFNYGPEAHKLPGHLAADGTFIFGGATLAPAGVACWRTPSYG